MKGFFLALKLVALATGAAAGFWLGWRLQAGRMVDLRVELETARARIARQDAERDADLARHAAALERASSRVVVKYVEGRERVRTVTQEVVREIPVAVPVEYDRDCPLPFGWVRLHDAAARGILAEPSSRIDGTPSAVVPSTALATVARNYGTCHETAERLIALQEWVRLQAEN